MKRSTLYSSFIAVAVFGGCHAFFLRDIFAKSDVGKTEIAPQENDENKYDIDHQEHRKLANCKYYDKLKPGKYLKRGQCLCWSGYCECYNGERCNLCVTKSRKLEMGGNRIARGCDYVRMQKDGNFVCYKGDLDGKHGRDYWDKWATNTAKKKYAGDSLELDGCCFEIGNYRWCD